MFCVLILQEKLWRGSGSRATPAWAIKAALAHRQCPDFGLHVKPWVARIVDTHDHYGFAREFVQSFRDYRNASRSGKGVMHCYFLTPGLYEINEIRSWKHTDRYFARCAGGELKRIEKETLLTELSKHDDREPDRSALRPPF